MNLAGVSNKEALVSRINSVTVLDFSTDRPVRQVRALLDGIVVDTTGWNDSKKKGIKIVVERTMKDVTIHLETDGGGLLNIPFPMSRSAFVGERESYGPGHLRLSGWTEVYGLTQYGEGSRSLKVEVK